MTLTSGAQHWTNCDDDIRGFVLLASDQCRRQLGISFLGSYLHGSLALGSFRRATSDLDMLIVTKSALDVDTREEVTSSLMEVSNKRPLPGDLELSVVQSVHLNPFIHPCPYEVHYSESLRRSLAADTLDYSGERVDRDLAAHCQVLRSSGVVLAGEPISHVIGAVKREAYVDALLHDLADIVHGSNLTDSPVYGILNACRVLCTLSTSVSRVVNKEEGGVWGLAHMPRPHRLLVGQALEAQRGRWSIPPEQVRTGGVRWDPDTLDAFRDYVTTQTSRLLGSRIVG